MPKVLVIDDDPQMRRMLVRILGAAGHDVIAAADGVEGLQQFRDYRPSVVVADLLMPRKEGIETIKDIRRESSSVRIIAMSGGSPQHAMGHRVADAGNLLFLDMMKHMGADALLPKPFRASELIRMVEELMALKET